MKISNFLFFLFVWVLGLSYGQEREWSEQKVKDTLNFHLINVTDGLSHNFINDIKQDSLGFMWIATIDGLNRYDGTNFVQFKKHFENPWLGIANNYVQQIKLYGADKLLITTDKGLDVYDFKKENFRLINGEDGLINNNVSCIAAGSEGQMVIGTYGGGVQIADKKWNINALRNEAGRKVQLSSNEISSVTMQGDSILWIGTYNNGLNKFSFVTKTITQFPNSLSSVINSLYTDKEGNLWIGSRKGLQVFTVTGDTINLSKTNSPCTGLSDDDVLCFEEDDKGQMWIGTRNGGLNILDKHSVIDRDQKIFNQWYLPASDGSSVYNRTVSVIFMDRDKSMWLGTPTGINYVNPEGETVKLIQRNVASSNSISHNRIGALGNSNNGKVWIGTDGGGLDYYNPQDGKFRHYVHKDGDPKSLSNDYVLSILEASADRVWVGTYQGGINRLNPETGICYHYLQGSTANGSDVRVIFQSTGKDIWVGTNRGGLYKYDRRQDTFEYIKSLGKIDIRDIDEDPDGNLWLATFSSGIIWYNPAKDDFKIFDQGNTKTLNSNVIFSILALENGAILAGTRYGGLLWLDPKKNTVRRFTEIEGLSNNTISSIVRENRNYVWLGTYNGISRYNVQTNEILDISSQNNIQNGEFNIGAAIKNETTGNLYFGGNNGLNIFDPTHFQNAEEKYPIIIEGLKVLNEEVEVGERDKSVLEESLPYNNNIALRYDQNSFSVSFAALKYPEARNITYSYKLENYNDFWINTKNAGVANFTAVPPGKYNLKIKTNSGMNDESFQNLSITIVPPFWKTIPAYILYLVVFVTIIWLGSRYYSDRVHLKNSLLFEKKQRQLEHDLNEERLRFFTAFSHELKTPLTLILAPLENLLSQEKNKSKKDNLLFIRRNAKTLFNSINKLLEFRKSEEGLSKLNMAAYNLAENLKKWIENYQPLAKDKKISLTFSIPEEKRTLLFDYAKIEVIVNNLLSNAIKYCENGGEVDVSLTYEEDYFKVKVRDTGTGISYDELSQIFNWYYRSDATIKKSGTGVGLALSKRFAELHNGSIEVSSSTEKKETIFILSIPIIEKPVSEAASEEVEQIEENVEEPEQFIQNPLKNQQASISSRKDRDVILLIDDNPEIVKFLDSIFKRNYDVLHAENGREGIEKASQYIPDIIISDVMMPEKTGIDLCYALKNQSSTSHIPIILLTAKANAESINAGYEEGADDYITKPFHPKLLETRVKNLIGTRRQLQQYFQLNNYISKEGEGVEDNGLLDKEKKFLSQLNEIILEQMSLGKDNVDVIAQEIGMSRTSLYRKLKAITGNSINEYIRNFKVERAAALLKNEKYTVSQASYEVGFNNIKYFRKIFKERYGESPSVYKKK